MNFTHELGQAVNKTKSITNTHNTEGTANLQSSIPSIVTISNTSKLKFTCKSDSITIIFVRQCRICMENLNIQITVSPELYTKNPDSSELGQKIISKSIELINELGFEDFNFKKLGLAIESPESSVYRYFTNKQALLVYLTSWYWTWTEYRIVFATTNVEDAIERLKTSIEILTQPVLIDKRISYVNEVLLSEIIFSESLKAYHNKNVDEINSRGCYKAYKSVVQRVSYTILELRPEYAYPHMLVTTVIEGAHQQKYFAEHLPRLTDTSEGIDTIPTFYTSLVLRSLGLD